MNNVTLAIDFGTNRTKVAYYDERIGEPRLIKFADQNQYGIPSKFYLPKQGGKILIGRDAQGMEESDPDGLVIGLKRNLHKPGKVRRGFGREAVERTKLASKLFDYIRNYCAKELGSDLTLPRCVLCVPSGFHEPQREALKQAAKWGGFTNTILVDEAIAAAQAWLAENGKEMAENLLVVDVSFRLAGFTIVQYIDGNFRTSDAVLPTSFDARSRETGAFEDRVVEQVRYFAKAARGDRLEILLIGSGSRQSSLKAKIEGLNVAPLHIPKQAEFAVVLGSAMPLHLVILRQRLVADLKEIDQAERELLDLDFVLKRLSPQRAADWKQAAAIGWPEGQWLAGACHFERINGWEHDTTKAARYFQQAVEAGFRKAYSSLAACYDEGEGVSKDPAKAVELWNAAAACGGATRLMNGPYPNNSPADATRVISCPQCSQKLRVPNEHREMRLRCKTCGHSFIHVREVGGYLAATANYEFGDPNAAVSLAEHYLEGRGVPADPERGMNLLRTAAAAGSPWARWLLGTRYLGGAGCERNESEAQRQFKLAFNALEKPAGRGGRSAQWFLGFCYLKGFGVRTNLPMAIEWLSKSAEQEYPLAQATLADCYVNGTGVTVDAKKAVELLRHAANAGVSSAQFGLGFALLSGFAGTVDRDEAFKWFRRSADCGDTDGQYQLGCCFIRAIGVNENKREGFDWIKRAAEQGHAQAQNDIGQCLLNGIGVKPDSQAGINWLKKSADQNCPDGICDLALCYRDGVGIKQDRQQAAALFRKAAEMGHLESMLGLGISILDNSTTSSSKNEAVSWFRRAAEQNHPGALFQLGLCYVHSIGLGKDADTGFSHIQRAAEMGDSNAQSFVGSCWLNGDYVSRNHLEAVKWFTKAAEQGNFDGQVGLGKCYLNGWGVPCNVQTAAKYVQQAADAGHAEANTILGKCYASGLL